MVCVTTQLLKNLGHDFTHVCTCLLPLMHSKYEKIFTSDLIHVSY